MEPTIETLERIADRYGDRIKEFEGRAAKSHFNHLMGSLCIPIYIIPDFLKAGGSTWENEKNHYRKAIRMLRAYLNLLKKFPEFRKGELTDKYFPEIQSTYDAELRKEGWLSGSHYYINEANRRLRNKN